MKKYSVFIPFLFLLIVSGAIDLAYHKGLTVGAEQASTKADSVRLDKNRIRQKELDSLTADAANRVHAAEMAANAAWRAASIAKARADSARARVIVISDSSVSIDNKPAESANPVLITALERSDERHVLDSAAIALLHQENGSLRSQNRVQALSIENLVARDSLHLKLEGDLREEVKTTGKAKFWQGVKYGAGGVLGILGVIAIIAK